MNSPLKKDRPVKDVYASSVGLRLPPKILKLMIGAEIQWSDENPLSQDMEECLHFYFESHTKWNTDLLLRRYGLSDVSQFVNVLCKWDVHMQIVYETPNNKEKSHHIDHHYFSFRGTIFPLCEEFKKHRDSFYLAKNLEHTMVPDEHKNKGYYQLTKFKAVIAGA